MQSADIARTRARLKKLAAAQQLALDALRSNAAELAALFEGLVTADDGAVAEPLELLGRLLRRLQAAADRAAIVELLATAAAELLPAGHGAIRLSAGDGDPELIAAWDGARRWQAGGEGAPDGLLREIAALPPERALRLPLRHAGMDLGEMRLWPAAAPQLRTAETLSLLAVGAGMALSALTLKHRLGRGGVRDALTGLFNRRYMEATLARELHRARRARTPLGLLLFDIDRLREVNQAQGTAAGDRLLETVGGLLQSTFRGSDACCRIDGQRFVVVLPDAPLTDCLRRAEELLRLIAELRPGQRTEPAAVSACAGVAGFPDHAEQPDTLLLAAEAALYLAKRDGPGRARLAEKGA